MEEMPGWVEERARIEARLYRDGPERWRDLRASIRRAVDDYGRFYSPAGQRELEYSDCLHISDDCIRVRTIPQPGRPDTSFEIRFLPEERRIECAQSGVAFTLTVRNEGIILLDKGGVEVSIEECSKAFLDPLLAKLPGRRPNIVI